MADQEALNQALEDRYAIEEEIGSGGMAAVYRAKDLKHGREVAVKVLQPELAATVGPDRFLQEIRIAAQLQHPHILPLHDSGEAGGFLYYVMPYVEGESLREKLGKEGELPVDDAVRMIRHVVDALAEAHSRGVVHRDIKPDNVMLRGRHALVTDFGVAKAVSEATGRHQVTTAGVALGTPAYMAPEQAVADPNIDHRADIYAVGALAYELLAGRPPFIGNTPQEVLAAHVTQAAEPVTTYRSAVSDALAQVVMKCLEKKPADRWQTAEELLRRLESVATPSGGITPTGTAPYQSLSRKRGVPLPVAYGVVGAFVVMAVLISAWLRSRTSSPVVGDAREPVFVVPFEVRGDARELSGLGARMADQISAAIVRENLAAVAPDPERSEGPSSLRPPTLRELARATSAATLVTGIIDQRGDSMEIRTSLVRGANLQPIYALPSEVGSLSSTGPLLDAVTERVLGAVGWVMDAPEAQVGVFPAPPSLEIHRLIQQGHRMFDERRFQEATTLYEEAFAKDTSFLSAAAWLVFGYFNSGRPGERDSILAFIDERRSRLTAAEALQHNHAVEVFWGNPDDEYRAAMAALAPDTTGWLFNALWSSVRSNRPDEALRFFQMRDPEGTDLERWYDHSARALHYLGRFEELLEHAREARQLDPAWPTALYWEVRALAALGRFQELETALAGAHTADSPMAPGDALRDVGIQLWSQGDTVRAIEMMQRAIDWAEAQGFEGSGGSARRSLVAVALYAMGRFAEAREHIAFFAEANPGRATWAGRLARVTARLGDTATAEQMAERLLGEDRTWLRASHTYEAAKIHAVLGNRERALALIRQALNTGNRSWWDMKMSPRDFESLRGYPPFEELIRPKG